MDEVGAEREIVASPRRRARSTLIAAVALQSVVASSGCDADRSAGWVPTYHRDVAPLLAERCGSCHSESGVAPFSVFDYAEVGRHASRIARATADRSMPPWLPSPGYAEYLNDPSLTDDEIALIARWVDAGVPEGRRPLFSRNRNAPKAWELGEPDLVLKLSEGYVLQPSPTDEYRVFVVPVPIAATKYVRAVDFRPVLEWSDAPPMVSSDTRMPVHHVVLMIDPTRSSRRLDADDPLPGYEGASPMSGARPPEGFFVGWTPGMRPSALPEGLAWRIDPGTDLVIQTHLQPTPQAVEVNASVGLYFADRAPTRLPSSILLSSISIDIPPSDAEHVVEDSYELPVGVDVLSVYPHAHFLAKDMELSALLPDGGRRWLLRIEDWDFNRQDAYRLREALHLPAGSVLRMRYTYDNSSANPQNPHDPPRRTTFGPRSTDEMAELTLQVLAADPTDRAVLERGAAEHVARTLVEGARFAVAAEPDSPRAQYNLGVLLHRSGWPEEAITAYRRALSLGGDDDPDVHAELGNALEATGATAEAESHYRRAIEVLPSHADAHAGLARILRSAGRVAEAETELLRALEIRPDLVSARFDLANLLADAGRGEEAIDLYESVVDMAPTFVAARINLARTYHLSGRLEQAAVHYRRTVELEPENSEAHLALGNVLRTTGHPREAVEQLRAAVRLEPGAAEPMLALAWALATEPDRQLRDPDTALRLARGAIAVMAPPDARALATLAAAHAAAGDFDAAVTRGQDALDLARRTGDTTMAQGIEVHLQLYRVGRPYLLRP